MSKARTLLKSPVISASDRFGFTLFMSALINAIVILGISFSPLDDDDDTTAPTLEVILVPTRSDRAPTEADFLAQSNQQGGGDLDEKRRPTTPSPAMITTSDTTGSPDFTPQLKAQPKPDQVQREMLTALQSTDSVPSDKLQRPEVVELKTTTAAELMQRSEEIARLNAELSDHLEAYAKKPRIKVLSSASTKEYKYASYLVDWERRVEKIGRLNFPAEAKSRGMQGSLLLDVAINHDGTIVDVQVRRSSGSAILDDAARRIVHLAAPFTPFPPDFRKDFDVLHITRTWQFLQGGKLDTQ